MRYAAIATALAAVALDQATKYWVEANLAYHQPVELLPFLALFRTYNTGIAFSMFAGLPDWILILLTLAIAATVSWLWASLDRHRTIARFGFAFILGGAIGNLIDRVRLGHVVDFILFHVDSWTFAVFNLADSFISIGAALIVLDELMAMRRKSRSAN